MKQEYLKEMLRDNKSVIIPGVGAFVNNDSKQMPLLFNEYLKFNDGALAAFISRKENIPIDEAGRKIEVFADGLKSLLDSGRDVVLPGMGKLNKSTEGKITFTYNAESGNESEKMKEKELQEKEKAAELQRQEQSEKEKRKEKELQEQLEKELQEKKKAAELQRQEQSEKEKRKEKELQEQLEKELQEKKKAAELQRQEQQSEKEKQKEKELREKEKATPVMLSDEEKLRRKKKKKRVILVLVIVILLGGGGTGGYLFKDQILGLFGGSSAITENKTEDPAKNTVVTPEINAEDTIATEETPSTESGVANEEAPVEENTTVEVTPEPEVTKTISHPQTSASSGTFYVIVGCYSDATNADRMIEKANAKGLQGENLGSYGGLQHISVYSSADLSDAAAKAMQIRSDFPNAWVFGKK